MSLFGQIFSSNKKKKDVEEDLVVISSPVIVPNLTSSSSTTTSEKEQLDSNTLAIHCDRHLEDCADVAPPLHMTTTYNLEKRTPDVYSRVHNVTRRRVETVIGTLEGGFPAITYSSGLSAVSALLFHLRPRKIFVTLKEGYWGSHEVMEMFDNFVKSYDKESAVELVDISELDAYIEENTKSDSEEEKQTQPIPIYKRIVVWLETPKNPTCKMEDIEMYSKKAKLIGARVVVDSTFASPVLQKPLLLGADYVFHSTTKFLGGHSDLLGGIVVTNKQGNRSELSSQRNLFGNVMGNMECWLLLRSLRTLDLRVNHQSKTATEIALWLESQIDNEETNKRVKKVWYPLEKSHPEHYQLCKKQMTSGPGILSVELDTKENARKLPALVKIFIHATSLGGYESLVDYRAGWDENESPTLLRLSIGLESAKDLINDLKSAFLQLK